VAGEHLGSIKSDRRATDVDRQTGRRSYNQRSCDVFPRGRNLKVLNFWLLLICAPAVATLFFVRSGRAVENISLQLGEVQIPTRFSNAQAPPLNRNPLGPVSRDPFAPAEPITPQPLQASVDSPTPAQPVQESPPALNLRFDGRMISPSGVAMIFASFGGDTAMILSMGQALPNGYVVKSITDHAVEFDYPPLGTSARLELPSEPRVGIR
jgi:hypothetical protein